MEANGCCSCSCCSQSLPFRYRSVKRKLETIEVEGFGLDHDPDPDRVVDVIPRVEMEEECTALREALASQQQTIQELYTELEEERDASSTAANETMSMILRLQREKAELQMEARQFRMYAEEKMAHDQEEMLLLEEAFCRREEEIKLLSGEIEAYKRRLARCGIDPESVCMDVEVNGERGLDDTCDTPESEYPPLRCNVFGLGEDGTGFGERICEMERTTSSDQFNVLEKEVVVGNSPHGSGHSQRLSTDSAREFDVGGKWAEEFPDTMDRQSFAGGDNTSDRIYTVDAVHGNSLMSSPTARSVRTEEADDIKKLYMRLQALEEDRESLKQTIISMRTDSTQLELLKAIAQNLSKGIPQSTSGQDQRLAKQPSLIDYFSCPSLFKWILSFDIWKKKTSPCRFSFGLSNSNAGLLLFVNRPRSSHMGQWRCLSRRLG